MRREKITLKGEGRKANTNLFEVESPQMNFALLKFSRVGRGF